LKITPLYHIWFSITYKSNMKTTCQSFRMIAHCLFTSIDSNGKSWEIRMRIIAAIVTTRPFSLPYSSENGRVVTVDHCGLKYPNAGDSILPRRSGPASGRFPEFCHLCGRLRHKMGWFAGMAKVRFLDK
jgi:hypothetical protein